MKIHLEGYTKTAQGYLNNVDKELGALSQKNAITPEKHAELVNDISMAADVISSFKDVVIALARGDATMEELTPFFCLEEAVAKENYEYSNKLIIIK